MKTRFFGSLLLAATTMLVSQAAPALALVNRGELAEPTSTSTYTMGSTTGTKTPTTYTPARASLVQGFTITTDSVVGTATVRYGGSGIVSVRWGDNQRSTYNSSSPMPDGSITPSAGQVVFKHVYDLPDGQPLSTVATASVESGGTIDFESRPVTVTPRFLVSQYQALFTPLNHCDTAVEEYTEWRISQRIDGTTVKTWWQDRDTGVGLTGAETGGVQPDFRPLEGSIVHREMVMADARVDMSYEVTELDEAFDDQAGVKHFEMHPSIAPSSHTLDFAGDDCRAQVKTDTDVRLLKPGLGSAGGPVASQG